MIILLYIILFFYSLAIFYGFHLIFLDISKTETSTIKLTVLYIVLFFGLLFYIFLCSSLLYLLSNIYNPNHSHTNYYTDYYTDYKNEPMKLLPKGLKNLAEAA